MKVQFEYSLFGLEPRDINVYEAMLKQPEGISIRSLADLVRMNRGTTFEIIKKLVRYGLVTAHYKKSRKYYVPREPAFLKKYAEERQLAISQEIGRVDAYIGQLQKTVASDMQRQYSQFYEGEEEIAILLHEILDETAGLPEKSYRVISSAEVSNHMYKKFKNFTRQRIKLGIFVRVIGIGGQDSTAVLAERKWLATEQMPASYILIYGTKVAHISLSKGGMVQASVTNNEGVAQLQALLFDSLWDKI